MLICPMLTQERMGNCMLDNPGASTCGSLILMTMAKKGNQRTNRDTTVMSYKWQPKRMLHVEISCKHLSPIANIQIHGCILQPPFHFE